MKEATYKYDSYVLDGYQVMMTPSSEVVDAIMTIVRKGSYFPADERREDYRTGENTIENCITRSTELFQIPSSPLLRYSRQRRFVNTDGRVIEQRALWTDFANEIVRKAFMQVGDSTNVMTELANDHGPCFFHFHRGFSISHKETSLYYDIKAGKKDPDDVIEENKVVTEKLIGAVRKQVEHLLADQEYVLRVAARVDLKNRLQSESNLQDVIDYIEYTRRMIETPEDIRMSVELMKGWLDCLWGMEDVELLPMPTEMFVKRGWLRGPRGMYQPPVYDNDGNVTEKAKIYMCISEYGLLTNEGEGILYNHRELIATLAHEAAHHQIHLLKRQEYGGETRRPYNTISVPDSEHCFLHESLTDQARKELDRSEICYMLIGEDLVPVVILEDNKRRKPIPVVKIKSGIPRVSASLDGNADASTNTYEITRDLATYITCKEKKQSDRIKEDLERPRTWFKEDFPIIYPLVSDYAERKSLELNSANLDEILAGVREEMGFAEIDKKLREGKRNEIPEETKIIHRAVGGIGSAINCIDVDSWVTSSLRKNLERFRRLYAWIDDADVEFKEEVKNEILKLEGLQTYHEGLPSFFDEFIVKVARGEHVEEKETATNISGAEETTPSLTQVAPTAKPVPTTNLDPRMVGALGRIESLEEQLAAALERLEAVPTPAVAPEETALEPVNQEPEIDTRPRWKKILDEFRDFMNL